MNIVTEYPNWFIILCFLLGGVYAAILYYKNKDEDFSSSLFKTLAVFRFLSVTVISFLLLSPLFKTVLRSSEKPLIILAQDNSESVVIGKDSVFYKNDYRQNFSELISELSDDYDVKVFSFSENVTESDDFDFSGKQTDFSILFDELLTRFSNRNVGAVLLASDGIFNKGLNPVYSAGKIKFPVYTLALGDTSVQKDIILKKINFNRIAYLGNAFPVKVLFNANKCKGSKSILTISSKGNVLFSKLISIPDDKFTETVNIKLDAKEAGMQRFSIKIAPVENEISTTNNTSDIFIDILDAKQKILILARAPHPDISALKQAIESNYNYEVANSLIEKFDGEIGKYNLLILHQLPANKYPLGALFEKSSEKKIPLLFILGAKSDLNRFNQLNSGLRIITEKPAYNESLPVINQEFTLFTISEKTRKDVEFFPPLICPFGEYQMLNSANILFNQRIGSLDTKYPLVLFNQNLVSKTGIVAGEGLWRWRLGEFAKTGDHNAFNEIMTKMVQYLSVKVDKSFFKIICKNNFLENQAVEFDAEVYNQSYEIINVPEVEIRIKNSEGQTYPFVFGKTANAYHLNAGIFSVDNYTYSASVGVGDKVFNDAGVFTVSPLNIESVNTYANHNLLFQLANKHDGEMLALEEMNDFPEKLKEREDIKTITYFEKRYNELVNVFWVFVLIIILLSGEWFLRKRNGAY